MGFWTLFEVASMPILQILLISILGAFMATEYLNLLPADARKSLNKVMHASHIYINPFFYNNYYYYWLVTQPQLCSSLVIYIYKDKLVRTYL